MDQQSAFGHPQQQILGAALHSKHDLARQLSGQLHRYRPAQSGLAQNQLVQALVQDVGSDSPAGGFHFWELRHSRHPGRLSRRHQQRFCAWQFVGQAQILT